MDENYKYKVFGIHVQQASAPMYKTILVNIVPRYYLKNRLKIPIYIQQFRLDIPTTAKELKPD